jgi:hypothetical protein
MTRVRIGLIAVLASVAVAGMTISNAVAAPGSHGSSNVQSVAPQKTISIHGLGKNGKKFNGTYGIQRFVVSNGRVYALGILKGKLGGRQVTRNNVKLPASLTSGSSQTGTATKSTRQAASCTILHLVLGPINLNLLGLQVRLGGGANMDQPIVLDVTAHQGQGLLGDLLCGIDNALGGGGLGQLSGQLQQLVSVLNGILGIISGL